MKNDKQTDVKPLITEKMKTSKSTFDFFASDAMSALEMNKILGGISPDGGDVVIIPPELEKGLR